ncbi:MAG: hypothetical protein JXB07_19185 [Anaerolineae bacterium]|nr:hypothetical protein [Anaerolineae bacterium]
MDKLDSTGTDQPNPELGSVVKNDITAMIDDLPVLPPTKDQWQQDREQIVKYQSTLRK